MKRYTLYDHDTEAWATTTIYTSHEEAVVAAERLDNVVILVLEF